MVTTSLEHPGGTGPLYDLRDRLGVELAFVDVGAGADPDAVLAAFDAAIDERTRLVAVSHVLWATGAVMPIAGIAEIAHARGAILVVDGAQSAGAIPVELAAIGADVYAISAQKWLLGPEGMGAIAVAPGVRDRLQPGLRRAFHVRDGRPGRARRCAGRTRAGSSRPTSTGRRSSGWRARSAG